LGDCFFEIQSKVGDDLVVATSAGVDLFAGIADEFCEAAFYQRMDVFVFGQGREFTCRIVIADLPQTLFDLLNFIRREQLNLGEGIGPRTIDAEVKGQHADVDWQTMVAGLHYIAHCSFKASVP
jgi:hypothetical protein